MAAAAHGNTVLELFRKAATASQEAPGLLWHVPPRSASGQQRARKEVWSYAQLHTAALQAARALHRAEQACRGSHGDRDARASVPRVGIMVNEGPHLPLLELAILFAACAVVPLDPEDPLPRLQLLLEDAELAAVVVPDDDSGAASTAAACCEQQVGAAAVLKASALLPTSPEGVTSEASSVTSEDLPLLPGPDAVSHVFFTSGSTGRPKGCVCTHANLDAYCRAKNELHSVSSESIVFVASAHTFDPSIGDFFATWAAGGCVAIAPRATISGALGTCLQETEATHLLGTPALFSLLEATGAGPGALPRLQVVALGGELMPQRTVDTWAGAVRLFNVYGVTECTVYQAYAELKHGEAPRRISGSFPGGTEVFLVGGSGDDPESRVEPGSGAQGELWIAGPQVGVGYLKRPELTEERFRQVPQLGPCFRTGDIASALPTGGWSLLGRRDGMVKLRGRRVELGEIEEVLLTAAPELLLAAAVVLVRPPQVPAPRLVGWLVPRDTSDASIDAGGALCSLCRLLCEERLPPHMVPGHLAITDALPTTGTGKVSRKELAAWPLPPEEASSATTSGRPPDPLRTGAEKLVAATWQEVLGIPVASASAHFLGLGGDSMAALRVCQQLADKLHVSDVEEPNKPSSQAPGGAFGELLPEALLPMAQLKRPLLADFARHLEERFSDALAGFADVAEQQAEVWADTAAAGDVAMEDDADRSQQHEADLLHQASGVGATAVARHLLARGVPADGWRAARDACAVGAATGGSASSRRAVRSPLHSACANGHAAVVKLLLEARASVTATDCRGLQPVHLAMKGGSVEVFTSLVVAQAAVSSTDDDQQGVLHHAARSGASLLLLQALAETADTPAGGRRGGRPVRGGSTSAHKVGRAAGEGFQGMLNRVDRWGRAPLHWAVVNGHRTVVVWLLEAGATKSLHDAAGETPLQVAERRAQCRAQDRPDGMGASVFGDIATLLGGSAATARHAAPA